MNNKMLLFLFTLIIMCATIQFCSAEKSVQPSFALPGDDMRDPFWPIGYKPAPKEDPYKDRQPVFTPDWPKLKLKGITRIGNKYIAIIEGVGVVEEGRIIKKEHDGLIYKWKISSITEKGISQKKLNVKPVEK